MLLFSVYKHKRCVDHLAASLAMKWGKESFVLWVNRGHACKMTCVGSVRRPSVGVRCSACDEREQVTSLFDGDKRPCCTKSFYRLKLCELGKQLIKIHAFCMFYGSSQHEEAAFTSRFIWNGWQTLPVFLQKKCYYFWRINCKEDRWCWLFWYFY